MSSWRPDSDSPASPSDVRAAAPGARGLLHVVDPDDAVAGPRSGGRFGSGRVRALVAADLFSVALALASTYGLAEVVGPPAVIAPTTAAIGFALVALPTWIVVFGLYRLYEGQTRTIAPGTLDEVGRLFHALLAGSLLLLVLGQVIKRVAGWELYFPAEALMFVGVAIVLVPSMRAAVRTWVLPSMMRPRRALIVGAGEVGRLVERKIDGHPEYGLDLVGFVDDERSGVGDVLGRTEDLTRLVDTLEIDWVILTGTGAAYEETLERVRGVRRPDVHLSIVPNFFELFASNAAIEDIEGMPVVSLPPMRFSRSVRTMKRGFDLVVAASILFVLSPLLIAIAIAIKFDSPGPVLFRQRRHGLGGREFAILKFRTMVDGAERHRFELAERNELEDGPLFKIKDDPRITELGGFLRRWSLDELPQVWNVVRGDMSLVGPRPFVVHESEQITGWAGRRLETTPGITGLWQVVGRNDVPFDEMVKLDYIYVTSWSLWWDIKILCQTIPVVLARRGAY